MTNEQVSSGVAACVGWSNIITKRSGHKHEERTAFAKTKGPDANISQPIDHPTRILRPTNHMEQVACEFDSLLSS